MLHDRPRAAAYAKALKIVLEQKRKEQPGRKLFVLDVGTGTGLLSALAARNASAADDDLAVSVVACEQFPPMARLARRVLKDNGLGKERARVLCCRSEDLEVREGLEQEEEGLEGEEEGKFLLPARADVVVSEILDSLLVGEGILPVMRDVSSRGLMKDEEGSAVAIPSRGRVFVQAVRSRSLGPAGAGGSEGGEGGEEEREEGKRRQQHIRDGGSRCPVPLHLDPLYLSKDLVPVGEPVVLFDLDLARPKGKESAADDGDTDGAVVETSTVALPLDDEGDDASSSSSPSFDALAFWWEVDLAPGVSLSTAPCWAREKEKGEEQEERNESWTDHWRSCWVPVPLCRRRRRRRGGGECRKQPLFVRGVLRDTEISVEVLLPPEEEEEEENRAENDHLCPRCSVPSLYSPSWDWGWGTARGSPAALLLEKGAKAAVERTLVEAEVAQAAPVILVLGDGHNAAAAAAAAGKEGNLRVLALQPSRAGCKAVERFAASPLVEARLLSDSLSCSTSASSPPPFPAAVALLAEPHYRAAEANNLPWRLLDFWLRRDELVDRGCCSRRRRRRRRRRCRRRHRRFPLLLLSLLREGPLSSSPPSLVPCSPATTEASSRRLKGSACASWMRRSGEV